MPMTDNGGEKQSHTLHEYSTRCSSFQSYDHLGWDGHSRNNPRISPIYRPKTMFFLLLLLLPKLAAPNSAFTNFRAFSFPSDNEQVVLQSMDFPLSTGQSPLNISLTTGPNSSAVVTAVLCTENDGTSMVNDSNENSTKKKPLLFANSLGYDSALIVPEALSVGSQRECQQPNDTSFPFLRLALNSMLPGSQGTVAVRPSVEGGGGEKKDGKEGEENRVIAVEESELLLMAKQPEPFLLMLNGPVGSSELGEMEHFVLDLAIRRGSIELTLIHQCPPLNDSNSAWNQSFPLGKFTEGEYRQLIVGMSEPFEQALNITLENDNGTVEHFALDCQQELYDAFKQQSESESDRPLMLPPSLLLLSAMPASENGTENGTSLPVLAYSLSRTFRSLLPQNIVKEEQQPNGWSLTALIVLSILCFICLLATIGGCAIAAQLLVVQRKKANYDAQRVQALEQQMGFFEINLKETRVKNGGIMQSEEDKKVAAAPVRSSLRRVVPAPKGMDLKALTENAVGKTPGWL